MQTRCKRDDNPIAIGLSSGYHRGIIRFTSEDAGAIRRGIDRKLRGEFQS